MEQPHLDAVAVAMQAALDAATRMPLKKIAKVTAAILEAQLSPTDGPSYQRP